MTSLQLRHEWRVPLRIRSWGWLFALTCWTLLSGLGWSQVDQSQLPEGEQGTGVERHEGEMLDPELSFTDDQNRFVRMQDYFDGKRPTILSFNYSNCPSMCSVQLEKMATALHDIDLLAKEDFQVVSISIDPHEQVARARETKQKFTKMYSRPGYEDGWHFLTGDESEVKELAGECGVKYKYIPHQKLYSHPPVFLVISPKGKIVRYIYGLDYEPKTIKQALIEAAEGRIGSPINQFTYLTSCYLYDEMSGKYTFQAMAVMRIGGLLTAVGLCFGLFPYWLRSRHRSNLNSVGNQSLNSGPMASNETDKS